MVLVVVVLGFDFCVSFVLVWVLETHVAASRCGGGEILKGEHSQRQPQPFEPGLET